MVFRQYFYSRLPVRLHAVDSLDLRFDISPDDFRTFPNESAGGSDGRGLIWQGHMHQSVKALFLGDKHVRCSQHSGVNPSILQGTQALCEAADLQDCDILHRSQSEPL